MTWRVTVYEAFVALRDLLEHVVKRPVPVLCMVDLLAIPPPFLILRVRFDPVSLVPCHPALLLHVTRDTTPARPPRKEGDADEPEPTVVAVAATFPFVS